MKTASLAIAAVSLLQVVSAQPHRRRHVHAVEHQNVKKGGDVVVTVIDTVYAQATEVPEVWIYVDQDGKPVSTTTEYHHFSAGAWSTAHGAGPTPASSSSSTKATPSSLSMVQNAQVVAAHKTKSSSSVSTSSTTIIVSEVSPTSSVAPVAATPAPVVVASTPEAAPVVVASTQVEAPAPVATTSAQQAAEPVATTQEAAPVASSTTEASTPASTGSTASGGSGFGIVYSPYNADGTCKSQSQVNKDFESITGYGLVRIYGVDCNQVTTVGSAAKAKGLKLFAGIYDISDVASQVATIVAAVKGDWSSIQTISVGNELVNGGTSAATVVAAIGTARSLLRSAGFTGSVVTVDTLVAARNNPSICDASDFCAVNCHPFFDGSYAAADSGKFMADMIPTLSAVLKNKNQQIVITETGWPWQGETNGVAVPSKSNQAAAISSIKSHFSSNPSGVILFTAYNDMWKKNTAAQFGAEQYWGMNGADAPSSY